MVSIDSTSADTHKGDSAARESTNTWCSTGEGDWISTSTTGGAHGVGAAIGRSCGSRADRDALASESNTQVAGNIANGVLSQASAKCTRWGNKVTAHSRWSAGGVVAGATIVGIGIDDTCCCITID